MKVEQSTPNLSLSPERKGSIGVVKRATSQERKINDMEPKSRRGLIFEAGGFLYSSNAAVKVMPFFNGQSV